MIASTQYDKVHINKQDGSYFVYYWSRWIVNATHIRGQDKHFYNTKTLSNFLSKFVDLSIEVLLAGAQLVPGVLLVCFAEFLVFIKVFSS